MYNLLPKPAVSPFDELYNAFNADPNQEKLIIATGTILDESGEPLRLRCVEKAEEYLATHFYSKGYPPSAGIPQFLHAARHFVKLPDAAACATPSCGAIQLIFQLWKRAGIVAIKTKAPTWGMYSVFAEMCGLELRLFDCGVAEAAEALLADEALLLQASCNNPDGHDITREEYAQVAQALQKNGRLCGLDVAYQGVKCDILDDVDFVPLYACENLLVAEFFDKNFGIYAEGASVVYATDKRMQQHLEAAVSGLFGLAPVHGEWLVATVYERFFDEYQQEMADVRACIQEKKAWFQSLLNQNQISVNIKDQNGIYAYFQLSDEQVIQLRATGLYVVEGGRMNLCSINEENAEFVCKCLRQVL